MSRHWVTSLALAFATAASATPPTIVDNQALLAWLKEAWVNEPSLDDDAPLFAEFVIHTQSASTGGTSQGGSDIRVRLWYIDDSRWRQSADHSRPPNLPSGFGYMPFSDSGRDAAEGDWSLRHTPDGLILSDNQAGPPSLGMTDALVEYGRTQLLSSRGDAKRRLVSASGTPDNWTAQLVITMPPDGGDRFVTLAGSARPWGDPSVQWASIPYGNDEPPVERPGLTLSAARVPPLDIPKEITWFDRDGVQTQKIVVQQWKSVDPAEIFEIAGRPTPGSIDPVRKLIVIDPDQAQARGDAPADSLFTRGAPSDGPRNRTTVIILGVVAGAALVFFLRSVLRKRTRRSA